MKLSEARYKAKSEIKNIIFDWGGVITDLHIDATLESLKDIANDNIEILLRNGPDEIFKPFELGKITPAEFRNRMRKYLDPKVGDDRIDAAWNALLGELPPNRWELLERVRAAYRTFLLSNTNEIHVGYYFNYLHKKYGKYGYTHLFDKTYFSFELGMRKPDAELFEYVIRENGLLTEETLLIDDSEENIETAMKLGFQTHLLKKPDTLSDLFE